MAGDLAAADRNCTAGLAQARAAGDQRNLASGLAHKAVLDLLMGHVPDAEAHVRELLPLAKRMGNRFDVLNGLDCCGHLCAATGRTAEAVTIWSAYTAIYGQDGSKDAPTDVARRARPLRQAREALGEARARAAEDRGAAMNMATAAEYAFILTTAEPQPPQAPVPAGLSARERELVTLVAQGLTDAQIAAKLFISVRTVGTYLDRIRDKTGARRRADLTRLALAAGLV